MDSTATKRTPVKELLTLVIQNAEKLAVDKYTARLREHADIHGWPSEITSQLSITYKDGNHQITYPEHLKETILTLEYGTPSIPPMPAMRSFMLGNV